LGVSSESKEIELEVAPPKEKWSRRISWLGGAYFGRRSREVIGGRPLFGSAGTWQIFLLDAAMVAISFLQEALGPRPTLAAAGCVSGLTVLWLRRYGATTQPTYRWIARVLVALPLLLLVGPIASLLYPLHP
jgi:hypothetical protein